MDFPEHFSEELKSLINSIFKNNLADRYTLDDVTRFGSSFGWGGQTLSPFSADFRIWQVHILQAVTIPFALNSLQILTDEWMTGQPNTKKEAPS